MARTRSQNDDEYEEPDDDHLNDAEDDEDVEDDDTDEQQDDDYQDEDDADNQDEDQESEDDDQDEDNEEEDADDQDEEDNEHVENPPTGKGKNKKAKTNKKQVEETENEKDFDDDEEDNVTDDGDDQDDDEDVPTTPNKKKKKPANKKSKGKKAKATMKDEDVASKRKGEKKPADDGEDDEQDEDESDSEEDEDEGDVEDLDDDEDQDDVEDLDDDEDEQPTTKRGKSKRTRKSTNDIDEDANASASATWTEETWKLKDLKSIPLQQDWGFLDRSEHADKALAENIKRNGLRDKIHILPRKNKAGYPPGTMLDGERRRDALVVNGETKTTVIVRNDLANADKDKVEAAFLDYNPDRRHLDQLTLAVVEKRKFEIENGRSRGGLRDSEKGEVRDRVGKRLGWSGKKLDRLLHIARAPKEVQDAYRAKKLPQGLAEKVGGLDAEQQQEIAQRIRDGADPKTVVAEYVETKTKSKRSTRGALDTLYRAIERLDRRLLKKKRSLAESEHRSLKKGRALIKMLLAKPVDKLSDIEEACTRWAGAPPSRS